MRAREFITEDDLTQQAAAAIPGARIWPELDNSSPYMAYRYGIALAAAPNTDMARKGTVKQNMVTLGYTDADDEITRAAGKHMGVSSKQLSSPGSKDSADNTTSPVAKRKKNRYGV